MRKLFEIGGIVAGLVLVIFGAAAIYMGVDGRSTVRDSLKQEQITFGGADDPAVAKYASQWADQPVETGTQARAFAQIIHEHALESSGGLTLLADGALRLHRRPGEPGPHERRGRRSEGRHWEPRLQHCPHTCVTATALSTALNVSYIAQQMALFGIVVGIALLLSGIGFIVLALSAAHSRRLEAAPVKTPTYHVATHTHQLPHSPPHPPPLHIFGRRRSSGLGERLLEVGPEVVGILEPDREPQQAGRDAIALPAVARLQLRPHRTEAGRVLDHAYGPLDPPRRVGVGHVERDEEREARVADDLDRRVPGQPLGEEPRGPLLPLESHRQRPQPSVQQPGGVGRGHDPRPPAHEVEPLVEIVVPHGRRRRPARRRARRAPS